MKQIRRKQTKPVKAENVALDGGKKDQISMILARTDWGKYWEDVSSHVEREVESYDSARARSLATASRRILR